MSRDPLSVEHETDAIRRFYDEEYYANDLASAPLPWHCRSVARRLGDMRGREVLDVACGTGGWLRYFHRLGAKGIAGIDLSHKAIEAGRKASPDAEFHCGSAEVLPFSDDRFDLVTCMGSLEHFQDKVGALREMLRVARKDATFVLLVPNAGFLTRRLGLYKGTAQSAVREDVLSLDQWAAIFDEAGLRVSARWRDLHPLSFSWICTGRPWHWPLRALQALALCFWPVSWQYQVYHVCERHGR